MTVPDNNEQQEKPTTFERIDEYKAVLDNLSGLSSRRQNTNNVYVGLNTVFLTALGFFLSTHLNFIVWSTAVAVGIMTLPLVFLNTVWLCSLKRYGRGAQVRYDYLREIEKEFRGRRDSSDDQHLIGLFTRIKDTVYY